MYDFDTVINRRHTDSLKWNVPDSVLPMWVADMDFRTCPDIIRAVSEKAALGIYGYTEISDAWRNAYIHWWERRHSVVFDPEWLIFCTGVVPAISSIVRKLTTPAEKVVILTPVYNIFYNSILNNGRVVSECPLHYDGTEYFIDFSALEERLSDPQATLMILCDPQNPVGKIWDRKTLAEIGRLCAQNGVTVLSDEIHCDLTDPGCEYVPFLSASPVCREISVTCIAPTKAFNLAGLQTSAVVVPDSILRNRVNRALNTDEVAEPNFFACTAAIAAFEKGEPWLNEARQYLSDNKQTVRNFISHHIPQLTVTPSDATYLLWIYCGKIAKAKELAAWLRTKTGLFLSVGDAYGGNGSDFLRMNVACPRSILTDGLKRLEAGISAYCKEKEF